MGSVVGLVGLSVGFSKGGAKFASLSSSVCFLLNPYNSITVMQASNPSYRPLSQPVLHLFHGHILVVIFVLMGEACVVNKN